MSARLRADFTGHRVVVTGAARGIGRGLALRFRELGADVTATDLDDAALDALAADAPGMATAVLDATDIDAVDAFFAAQRAPFDIVCANVGYSRPRQDVTAFDAETWRRSLDGNLTSAFAALAAGARRMRADGIGGRILVTASVASVAAEPGYAPYAAAKWGVLGLVKSAAVELAPHGILVNAVCPGDVDTAFLDGTVAPGAGSGPLGRRAQVAEVVDVFVALAGSAGTYITGEAVVIDGGLSLTAMA